jgi:hypothetical protein
MHPQFAQSGVPPNWHGVIRVQIRRQALGGLRERTRQAILGGIKIGTISGAGICSFDRLPPP